MSDDYITIKFDCDNPIEWVPVKMDLFKEKIRELNKILEELR